MAKKLMFLVALILLICATPVFAQAPGAGSGITDNGLKYLGAVVGMALASGLCGLGQGKEIGRAHV